MKKGGDVAQLVEHRPGTPPRQVRFPGVATDFSPRVNFQCRFLTYVRTPQTPATPPNPTPTPPQCTIACINICAHVKDPMVHVRVRWITETLKHPVCAVVLVARLCRSWLSPGKATRIFPGRNPSWTIYCCKNYLKKKKGKKKKKNENDDETRYTDV